MLLQEKHFSWCCVVVFVICFKDIENKPQIFSMGVLPPFSGEREDYTKWIFHNCFFVFPLHLFTET